MPNCEALGGHLLVVTVENLKKVNSQDESWTTHFLNAREVHVCIYLFIYSFVVDVIMSLRPAGMTAYGLRRWTLN